MDSQICRLKKLYQITVIRNSKNPLSTIVDLLISPKLLSKYTWTGKANKLAFKSLIQVHDVLFRTMRELSNNYTWQKFNKDLIYGVIKYAYKYADINEKTDEDIVTQQDIEHSNCLNTTFIMNKTNDISFMY